MARKSIILICKLRYFEGHMFDNLSQRLSSVVKSLRGQARLSEDNIQDALRDVRMALLEADVALPVVRDFISAVKVRALGQEVLRNLSPGQAVIGVVHNELTRLMGAEHSPLNLATRPPAIILLAGLQGAGKTTTAGKLARLIREDLRKKVLLVSCDVYRPAAVEQLQTLAGQANADFFKGEISDTPIEIAKNAIDYAKRHYQDVLIIDTAGRLSIDEAMMSEIRLLHELTNPIETFFVVDSMQGQDAVNTARAFADSLPLTGVIITKLDGDARGGAALSVRAITGVPIKFAGVGEKLTGLEPFHPERMASRILGMGDVIGLIEEARRGVDTEEAEKFARKIKAGKGFDLEDFKLQMVQMRKMGGVTSLLDKLPQEYAKLSANTAGNDKVLGRVEGIINSMTPLERAKPEIIKAARKRRIAAGAGVQVQDVNRLLAQFEQMQKMMKTLSRGGMGKMMRQMQSMIPMRRH